MRDQFHFTSQSYMQISTNWSSFRCGINHTHDPTFAQMRIVQKPDDVGLHEKLIKHATWINLLRSIFLQGFELSSVKRLQSLKMW